MTILFQRQPRKAKRFLECEIEVFLENDFDFVSSPSEAVGLFGESPSVSLSTTSSIPRWGMSQSTRNGTGCPYNVIKSLTKSVVSDPFCNSSSEQTSSSDHVFVYFLISIRVFYFRVGSDFHWSSMSYDGYYRFPTGAYPGFFLGGGKIFFDFSLL